MKRFYLLFISALLSLAMNARYIEVDGIFYRTEGLEAEVTSNPDKYYGEVIIPTTIKIDGIKYKVTSIGSLAFADCDCLTSVMITNNIKSIKEWAFKGCTNLSSIIISKEVQSIGDLAFADCKHLTSFNISSNVTSIGMGIFSGCSNLTSIIVESANAKYDSRNNCNAIIETETNTLIAGCQKTIIPNTVQTIGMDAFYGCSTINTITIPNSVKLIDAGAFRSCTGLVSIKIPDSVTSLGSVAFADCTNLASVTLPKNNTNFGGGVFGGCESLTRITIPKIVTNIGETTFNICHNLRDLYCYAITPPIAKETTFTFCRDITLHVPASAIDAYRETYPWKYFKSIVAIK